MKLQRSIIAGTALAMALAPVVAQAEPAARPSSRLSLSQSPASANQVKRAGAAVSRTSRAENGRVAGIILGTVATGILLWLAIRDGKPDSP